jgi:catecholate siderophore receptor
LSNSSNAQRRPRLRRNAVIAVLTASTILGGSEAVFAQTPPAQPTGTSAAAGQQRFFVRISAGSLDEALGRFTAQTGIRVVRMPGSLTGLLSPGVNGSLGAADALRALLAGTGLTFSFTSLNVAVVQKPGVTSGALTLAPLNVEGQSTTVAPDANPYADPAAPYKADRLSSSKFTESILNTPRDVTVLTKEALQDKDATSLREIGRSTAGVTLGSGEGGNAFGDRFFIRGFDARNDIFVDGVRDPGVSIRENFDTEQVEILRGPASSFAGRGTTGGAINIVTKQAGDRDFYDAELTAGFNDGTNRATIDFNKALSPTLDVRLNALAQGAGVAGRDYTTDNRKGIAGAITFKPTKNFTITANYSDTDRYGLPDFGVPYDLATKSPVTENVVPRNTYYGIINRDFTNATQDLATLDAQWNVNAWLTLENKARLGNSLLNYIGTIPENPSATNAATAPYASTATFFSGYTQLNAQSRYEPVRVLADQPQATFTFTTGDVKHTAVFGGEFSAEHISIDSYSGFTSELATGPVAFTSSGAPIVSVYNPTHYLYGAVPVLTGNPLRYQVNTNAGYLIDTANYHDRIILNAGLRYDNYYIGSANNTSGRSDQANILSYNAGLDYKPVPNGTVYVAYATAADPVGDELDAISSSYGGFSATQNTTQIFGPLLSRSVEAGTKWEFFNRHMLATAAEFQTNVNNARETAPANLPGYTSGQIVSGASYRVNGFDFELAGKITDKIDLLGGFVLMTPVVTGSIVPTNIGLQLANIARQSFNLLAKYELTRRLEFGAQSSYVSQILGGSLLAANGGVAYPNPPSPTILPQHWRHDAFVEAKINDHVELKLYAQNLFNKTYYDSLYQSAIPFIMVAPGRTISLIGTLKL